MDNTITAQLMKFKVAELKQELIKLGIQPRGLKADLVNQLANALIQQQQQQQQIQQQQFQQQQQQIQQQQHYQQQLQQHSQQQQIFIDSSQIYQPQVVAGNQFQINTTSEFIQCQQPIHSPQGKSANQIIHSPPPGQQIIHSPPPGHQIIHSPPPGQQIIHSPPPGQQIIHSPPVHQIIHSSPSEQIIHSPSVQQLNNSLPPQQIIHSSDLQANIQSPSIQQIITSPEAEQIINSENQTIQLNQEDLSSMNLIEFNNNHKSPEEFISDSNHFTAIPPQNIETQEINLVSNENAENFNQQLNEPTELTNEFLESVEECVKCDKSEIGEIIIEQRNEKLELSKDIECEQVKDETEILNKIDKQKINEQDFTEETDVDYQQKLLQELNITEEEWLKKSKNNRRKLKKKLRNKIKRKERDEIEKRQQELKTKQREFEKNFQNKMKIKTEVIHDEDDDRMDIDEEDAPEEEKELKRLEEINRQNELTKLQKLESNEDVVEIEYIPEDMPKDSVYLQFLKVFDKFSAVSSDEAKRLEQEQLLSETKNRVRDHRAKLLELKKPVELELKDDDDKNGETIKLSKRKMKQISRMSVADLKQRVAHPELVEMHDVTAKDPVLLLYLKSTRNTVPVPRHWCYKRKYLQGKRGFEKPPFKLPEFIRRTGIQEMREAILEKEDSKTLKTKMKEKIRPKMGKIDIDYQKLHDAFFKWQTKPKVTIHGDLYYEGREFETRLKDKKPGELTNELRQALGMPTGTNAYKCPPPWLIAMQRYGPPPSYPNIKIPGLNAPIPEGCCFGYHAGGWGKPPVDEYGRPLYGDVFGLTSNSRELAQPEEEIDRKHWGEMESDEEEEEEDDEEEEEETKKDSKENEDNTGFVTPAVNLEGLVTPSGLSTGIPSGLETPDMIELRKRKQQIEAEMESGDQQQLFTVVPEKKVDRFSKDMMGSMHVYDFASLSKTPSKFSGVEVALDPSELESGQLDNNAVAAKYEQTLRESSSKNPHEDLSDMVAEHASKQKRKKQEQLTNKEQLSGSSTSKSSKKYQFKF